MCNRDDAPNIFFFIFHSSFSCIDSSCMEFELTYEIYDKYFLQTENSSEFMGYAQHRAFH